MAGQQRRPPLTAAKRFGTIQTICAELTAVCKQQVDRCEQIIDGQRADIGRLKEQVKQTAALKTRNDQLEGEVDRERQAALAEREKSALLQSQLDTAAGQFELYNAKVAHLTAALRLRAQCGTKQRQCDRARAMVGEQQTEIARLKAEVLQLQGGYKDKASDADQEKERQCARGVSERDKCAELLLDSRLDTAKAECDLCKAELAAEQKGADAGSAQRCLRAKLTVARARLHTMQMKKALAVFERDAHAM